MEHIITLDVAPLQAAALVAMYTKNKPNEVLTGVNISATASGEWSVAALDNAMVFAGRLYVDNEVDGWEGMNITIPATVISRLPKKGSVDLFHTSEESYMVDDVLFSSAGSFPNWRQLVPTQHNLSDPNQEHLPLPPNEVVAGYKALAMYHGVGANSSSFLRRVILRGRKPAVLYHADCENLDALVLVQPNAEAATDYSDYSPPLWV